MVQLDEWRERFEALGVKVAGMAYDDLEILSSFHAERELGYPLLRDADAKHAISFDVLNEYYKPGSFAYGIPHPGIFYISPEGTVLAKVAVPGYRQRPPMEDVFEAVQQAVSN